MEMTTARKITNTAWFGLTDAAFEMKAGFCQRFVRQVVQKALGGRFNGYWRDTADKTARAFLGSRFVVHEAGFGAAGDLLYWYGSGNQTAGHVAINLDGARVAHNSVTDRWDAESGHKGTRLISRLRAPDLIIRLSVV
jgi:hypothetical protein